MPLPWLASDAGHAQTHELEKTAMQALSTHAIVMAWEQGWDKYPAEKALVLLALACPDLSLTALKAMTVGRRNSILLSLRQKTLGNIVPCLAQCPHCHEALEFELDITTLLTTPTPVEQTEPAHDLVADDFQIRFHLPTSLDLLAITSIGDSQIARDVLLERCILHATHAGDTITASRLPETVITRLAQAMIERDPQATIEFTLECALCEQSWMAQFDIVAFFWTEIEAQAKHVLSDVHTLASAYGWREADILAMSTARRQIYLELVRA